MDHIEIFKTNINDHIVALNLVRRIEDRYTGYGASFDLDDCDRILRIVSAHAPVDTPGILSLVAESGYRAEILPDDPAEEQSAMEQAAY